MKKLNSIIVGAGILAGILGFTPRAFAEDAAKTLTHADKAAAYEQKAVELDAVVADHTQMKKAGMTEKTQVSTRQKMEKHCDAIIADAAKLRDDYRAFATWHKMQATEEKGK
jgi:hypothetical protein